MNTAIAATTRTPSQPVESTPPLAALVAPPLDVSTPSLAPIAHLSLARAEAGETEMETSRSARQPASEGMLIRLGGMITSALHALLAADPSTKASFGSGVFNLGIDLVPFLGPLKKVADARALVHHENPTLQHEGRTLFVLGALEMLLDTITLGGSAFLPDEILTYPRLIRDYQRRANQETDAKSMFPDPISCAIRGALMIPGANELVDSLLGRPRSNRRITDASATPSR
jgi:hypothetical protein